MKRKTAEQFVTSYKREQLVALAMLVALTVASGDSKADIAKNLETATPPAVEVLMDKHNREELLTLAEALDIKLPGEPNKRELSEAILAAFNEEAPAEEDKGDKGDAGKAPAPPVPPPGHPPTGVPPNAPPPVERPPVEQPPVDRPPVESPVVERPPVEAPPRSHADRIISGEIGGPAQAGPAATDTGAGLAGDSARDEGPLARLASLLQRQMDLTLRLTGNVKSQPVIDWERDLKALVEEYDRN